MGRGEKSEGGSFSWFWLFLEPYRVLQNLCIWTLLQPGYDKATFFQYKERSELCKVCCKDSAKPCTVDPHISEPRSSEHPDYWQQEKLPIFGNDRQNSVKVVNCSNAI